MDSKECLTNEALLKEFGSQFELVKHAIRIAKHMIRSGKDEALHSDNPALEVLEQIAHNKKTGSSCPHSGYKYNEVEIEA